jgi:hypothetical protein
MGSIINTDSKLTAHSTDAVVLPLAVRDKVRINTHVTNVMCGMKTRSVVKLEC